jgi:uncharacterized protein YkwD
MRHLLFIFLLITVTSRAVNPQEAGINPEQVIYLTNQERVSKSLLPLQVNEKLNRAAYAKAQYILQKQHFSHERWESFIRESGYNYCSAGENLGLNQTEAREVIDAWMMSPSHRANILRGRYREIGVAVVKGRYKNIDDAVIIVQLFGSRCI